MTSHPPVVVRFYGGLGEIGRNMASVEVDGRLALLDAGLSFPDAEHFGIDLILPDWDSLRPRADDLSCVVITHGHEDHMGALPFLMREFPRLPVYGTRLTLGLLAAKLSEYPDIDADLREVSAGERVKSGPFDMEFVGVTHSIPDGLAVAFHTPHGTILHSGDFKLDQTPIDGRPTDLPHLAALGDDGIALLLADSTNADHAGHVASERTVGKTLRDVFAGAHGRVVITTFASHVHRVQQAVDAAVQAGRKVCFVGRSMVRNMEIARDLGYLHHRDADVVDMEEVEHLPRDAAVIICTGSQGEPYAALSLMAAGHHRQVQLEPGDTVIMASSVIPGNEHGIQRSINGLFRQGADVVYKGVADVHVSGHASADELRFFHNIVRPAGFVPVHGEYRHLVAHARIAADCGTPPDRVLICSDGDAVLLEDGRVRRGEGFTPGKVFVDGLGVGDIGNVVLRDRRHLGNNGFIVCIVGLDEYDGSILYGPEIISRGFVYMRDNEALIRRAADTVRREIVRGAPAAALSRKIRTALTAFCVQEMGRRPMVLPVVIEV